MHGYGASVKLFFRHPGYTVGACIQKAAFGMLLLIRLSAAPRFMSVRSAFTGTMRRRTSFSRRSKNNL